MSHFFARCASQATHGHARIARETQGLARARASLATAQPSRAEARSVRAPTVKNIGVTGDGREREGESRWSRKCGCGGVYWGYIPSISAGRRCTGKFARGVLSIRVTQLRDVTEARRSCRGLSESGPAQTRLAMASMLGPCRPACVRVDSGGGSQAHTHTHTHT